MNHTVVSFKGIPGFIPYAAARESLGQNCDKYLPFVISRPLGIDVRAASHDDHNSCFFLKTCQEVRVEAPSSLHM